MTEAFSGQSALVTGGGSGIGLACALAFARAGAAVAIVGRSAERLQTAADDIRDAVAGARVFCVDGDASDEVVIERAVAEAAAAAPLTVAVANAGTGGLGPIVRTDVQEFERIMGVNLRGTFLTFKHAGRAIAQAGGGAMCAVSSIAGVRTHRYMGPYCVSKGAIDMLVRNTADELGSALVRVNSVCPGLVRTELARGLLSTEEVYRDYLDCMPIRRHGEVDDIAAAVQFLCGPEAGWITGVNLPVDGGHHLRRGPNVETFARQLYGEEGLDPAP